MFKSEMNSDLLFKFEQNLRMEEKSENTVKKYVRDVKGFWEYVNFGQITREAVLLYKEHLKKEYAVSSANSMIASLNSFFKFAGWGEFCIRQFKVQRKAFCSEDKELTEREYRALVATAEQKKNKRLSLVIQTICATGIRVSELSYITVQAVKTGQVTVSCKGKTRRIFIVSALRKKLLGYAKEKGIKTGMLFVTKSGKALDRSNIWHEMKRLCRDAGVNPSKVFPHNLRHLFARTFYGIEKDIAKLADILGHSNINTTRIYLVCDGAEHRRKMERMHLIL